MTATTGHPIDRAATAAAAEMVTRRLSRKSEGPRDRRRDVIRPGGPAGSLALRRLLNRTGASAEFFVDVERRFPELAHARVLGDHLYIISKPEWIVDVFVSHGRDLMKGRGLQAAKALLGEGLLTSEGDFHLRQRRLVQPAFHRDRIAHYAAQMVERADRHQKRWSDGQTIDLTTDMAALTLAIVGDTLFGVDLTGDATEVGDALNQVLDGAGSRLFLGSNAFRIPTAGRRKALESMIRLDSVVMRMIDEHRAGGDNGDMLSMLIAAQEDGSGMSDEQLRDEAMTLVLAGHETTAMALSWSWLLLGRNPAAARWWRAELDEVLDGRDPSYADLPNLPRTRAVMAESMRLYPPAWIIGRRALADITVGEWTIPQGASILASPFALHRSPRWWDSALSFRPERWIAADGEFDESAPGQPRGAWFPFGWGNRKCIGDQFAWTEGSLVLAALGRRWEIDPAPGTRMDMRPAVTLRPGAGITATLRRR